MYWSYLYGKSYSHLVIRRTLLSCLLLLLFTQSGEGLFYTQTNKQVVSITPGGANRILTCHLNSSSLHSLSVSPTLIHTATTVHFCNTRLRALGVNLLERVPFLQKFLTQLSAKLFKQHECEQVCTVFVMSYHETVFAITVNLHIRYKLGHE